MNKIIYSAVDENPEVKCNFMKRMVGASGLEPPTSWSGIRFKCLWNSAEV